MPEGAFYGYDAERSKLLVQHGFIKKGKAGNYEYNKEKKKFEPVEGYKLSGKDADEEVRELHFSMDYGKTGFPKTEKFFRLSYEVYDLSLESPYYWILEDVEQKFPIVEKLEDAFAASENSAFFGVTQQRLGAQQDKVSQFLATTGKMIKELFQMVRELRIIDERLGYYNGIEEELSKPVHERRKHDIVTLKGMFVDLVQGGGKSAASVYGMARELEFITLPDLFFDAPPFKTKSELDDHMKKLEKDFNKNVLRVLIRHLNQFMEWRTRTHQEHKNRKRFQRQYLWQHFEIIQMYINWIKPYLKHVAKLSLKQRNMDSPSLVSAFEGSMLDIELLARKRISVGKGGANGCMLITINYRTRPEMKVVQEGYQRGPVHIGRFEMNFRLYGWTDKQVANYKELKKQENLLLMGEISASVKKAMMALGDELDHYLKEAQEDIDKNKSDSKKKVKKGVMESLFGDFYTPKSKKADKGKPKISAKELRKEQEQIQAALAELMGYTKSMAYLVFKNFKKAHRLLAW